MIEDIELYKNRLRPGARQQYTAQVEKFVRAVKGDYSKQNLRGYIDKLVSEGYAPTTIVRFVVPILKRFYRIKGIPWPLNIGELPEVDSEDIQNVALDNQVVCHLIDIAKTASMDKYLRALLTVSTVYGTRRVELCRLSEDSVNLRDGHITIYTAKGGRKRTHIIPPGLLRYMDVRFRPISQFQCSKAWWQIEKIAGLDHYDGIGWHAIRRSIVRELELAELGVDVINNFMRWSIPRFMAEMRSHYFNSKVVSFDGRKVLQLNKTDADVDNAVFAVHPYLKRWLE